MSFDGLRVLSLESRRAPEIETLIRRAGRRSLGGAVDAGSAA